MASIVSICNSALQKLGAGRITSLDDASTSARACTNSYEEKRDAELRAHPWTFATRRAILASSTTPPVHTYAYAFPLPAECLRLLSPDRYDVDWQIEDNAILTDDTTVEIRYIAKITDPNEMDPLFREVLACRLAMEMCEELTQSGSKFQQVAEQYKMALREARRVNAIERRSETPPEDSWLAARR